MVLAVGTGTYLDAVGTYIICAYFGRHLDFGVQIMNQTARPLSPTKLAKRAEALLRVWKECGLEVGGLVCEGDRVVILSPDSAKDETDPFEAWQRKQGDAA